MKLLLWTIYMMLSALLWRRLDVGVAFTFLSKLVLSIPLSLMVTIVIHELAHLITFRLFDVCVTEVRIGTIKIDFHCRKPKISICGGKIFIGYCTITRPSDHIKKGAIIGFAAGGISGIIESLGSFFILRSISMENDAAPFLCCLIIVGIYSFYTTLLRKASADNKAINKLMRDND